MRTFILFVLLVAGVTGQGFSTTFLQNTLFGGERSDFGVSSWSDQTRGVRYVVGQTYSSEFSGTPLKGDYTLGAPDILLVKLDQATDSLLWYTIMGTSRSDQPRAISGDSEGNIWITGNTFGSFDNSDSNGVSRGFVLKLDSNGKTLQSLILDIQPSAIDVDMNGNIWIAGSATSKNNADDENSNEDVAVIIISSVTGEQLASQTFGGSASDVAKTIAVAQNTVAVGGATFSSNFPVTQGKRVCESCSGAGFFMTLSYDSTNGIQQTFSTYIIGDESQSLSIVDIAVDSNDNFYLSMFDDSNAMGAYIQQLKSDFSLGWVSEKSDAFWKVDYLPLIDAVYTIGSFSTPTDYATFFVLDTKTGSHIYSSKALTGAIVDASVYVVDETTVKISMVGTLQKDLRITYHGRTYTTTHKSDDMLILSLNIRSLSAAKSQQQKLATVQDSSANVVRSTEARSTSSEWCLYNHKKGFFPILDLIYGQSNYSAYTIVPGGSSVVLPWESGHDYDTLLGAFVEFVFGNIGRPVRLPAGSWSPTFDLFFRFTLPTLAHPATFQSEEHSYIVIYAPVKGQGQVVVKNTGRDKNGDFVSWTLEVTLPGIGAEPAVTQSFTLSPKAKAPLNIWIDFNSASASDNLKIFASTDDVVTKPAVAVISITLSSLRMNQWLTTVDFFPRIASASTLETHLSRASFCGFTSTPKTVPIPLAPILPVTGHTNFPSEGSRGFDQAWVGQVIIPDQDSVAGLQVKLQFFRSPLMGGDPILPFTQAWIYVYSQPYTGSPFDLKKKYGAGYITSAGISGNGLLSGWVFASKYQFLKGTKYYFYVADGLTHNDELLISNINDALLQPSKRDVTTEPMLTYNKATGLYEESPSNSIVYSFFTNPPTSADPLNTAEPYNGDDTNNDGSTCVDGGCVMSDPFFVGYNGQKYMYKGVAGHMYNIYNDPWVNVNSLFGYANDKKNTGTVLHTIGISFGDHNLFFDITNRENRRFFDVVIDGVTTRVGYNTFHLSGCIDVQYNTKVLLVTTPRHSIRMTIEWGRNWHVNVPYFDLHIHHPEEDISKIGGLLGQSANPDVDDLNEVEENFKIDSIFSFEKSKYYNLASINC